MFQIRPIVDSDKQMVTRLVMESWGSAIVVSRGRTRDAASLPGFIAFAENDIAGLITYCIEGSECEIIYLESFREGIGVGSGLIDAVIGVARESGCSRVWLVTTNDNTRAIRFYQKRGFSLCAIRFNEIARSREIKPQIPLYGYDGIPIEHEMEFEKRLHRILEC